MDKKKVKPMSKTIDELKEENYNLKKALSNIKQNTLPANTSYMQKHQLEFITNNVYLVCNDTLNLYPIEE